MIYANFIHHAFKTQLCLIAQYSVMTNAFLITSVTLKFDLIDFIDTDESN